MTTPPTDLRQQPGVCQHDLLEPNCTVVVADTDPFVGHCPVCDVTWTTRAPGTGKQPATPHISTVLKAGPYHWMQPGTTRDPLASKSHDEARAALGTAQPDGPRWREFSDTTRLNWVLSRYPEMVNRSAIDEAIAREEFFRSKK